MIVADIVAQPRTIVDLFQQCGKRELRFIVEARRVLCLVKSN